MSVAAVVVTYNSERQVARCLTALLAARASVWVVDNASSDRTAPLVAERFPEVGLIENDQNVGFARAVNQALARTVGDVVLLVNPDCIVAPGTVSALAECLAANPEVGVVAPRLLDARGRTAISAHPFENAASVVASRFGGSLVPVALRRLLAGRRRRRSYEACLSADRPVPVDWVSGACLAVRGPLLRELGGLDTGYFLYYEDEELCLQVWRSGHGVVLLPTAQAVHLGGASSNDPAQAWPHLYRSLLRFQARHRPRTYGLVRAALVARALVGMAPAAVRDLLALARRRPARRIRAWAEIGRIALVEGRRLRVEAVP